MTKRRLIGVVTCACILLALLAASLVAWASGRTLAAVTARVRDPWRRALYVGPLWVVVGLVLFSLPSVAVATAYPLLHSEDSDATVCVAGVWPTFVLPVFLGYGIAVMRLRRRPTERGADVRG